VLVALITGIFVVVFRAASNQRQTAVAPAVPASTCVPTGVPPTQSLDTPTPTPDLARHETAAPPPPSPTPFPIRRTTDLSPTLAANDKGQVLVFHCDGSYELFLTGDPAYGVPLQPGDVVIFRALPISAEMLQAPTYDGIPTNTASGPASAAPTATLDPTSNLPAGK